MGSAAALRGPWAELAALGLTLGKPGVFLRGEVWVAMLLPRLRSAITRASRSTGSVATIVILRARLRWGPFATWSIALGRSTATIPIVQALRAASFRTGPALAFSARLVGARFPAAFRARVTATAQAIGPGSGGPVPVAAGRPFAGIGWFGGASTGVWRRGPRVFARSTASLVTLHAARAAFALGPNLFWLQFSVAIAIEFAERVRGVADFVRVDHAIVIGIESIE